MKKIIIISTFAIIAAFGSRAQSFTGLWEVNKVTVGENEMTPMGKWFRINEDGSFEGGNGWMQNSVGTWTFDKNSNEYLPVNTNGVKDPAGPFTVEATKETMTWKRQEEGMNVIVYLKRIDKLPAAPQDEVQGLWKLTTVNSENEISLYKEGGEQYAFIRWDRIFIMDNTPIGRKTGYWTMHGHRPEMTLLFHDTSQAPETYHIYFEDNEMYWESSNNDKKLVFTRIDEFPQ